VILIGRDEDDQWQARFKRTDHAQPIELRHLKIEQNQIRAEFHDAVDRLDTRSRLADDFERGNHRRVLAKKFARDGFVVCDQYLHCAIASLATSAAGKLKGIERNTALPSGLERTSSVAWPA